MTKKLLIAAVVSVNLFSVAALAAESTWAAPADAAKVKNPVASDAKSIAAGKQVFTDECAQCHGDAGKGDGPKAAEIDTKPADLTAARVGKQADGELFWKVTNGKAPMTAYGNVLSDEERWSVVNYVRTLIKK